MFVNRTLRSSGFTLVELLVVMAIIGILSALLLANFVGIRERAADSKIKNDARQLKTALQLYHNDFQHYPNSTGGNGIEGCGDGTDPCGSNFSANNSMYMKDLPDTFEYYSDGVEEFLIRVTLANASDGEAADSQERCNVSGRAYFTDTVADTDYFVCED